MTVATPDFVFSNLQTDLDTFAAGGAACWAGVDCVAWGNYTPPMSGLPSPAGTPANGTLTNNQVLIRSIQPNCPTLLEEADDTNNSLADFSFGIFPPRNNAATPTETPCATPMTPVTPATTPTTPTKKKKCKKAKKRAARSARKCKKKKH